MVKRLPQGWEISNTNPVIFFQITSFFGGLVVTFMGGGGALFIVLRNIITLSVVSAFFVHSLMGSTKFCRSSAILYVVASRAKNDWSIFQIY